MERMWRSGVVLAVLGVVACQPMYGARPQKLKTPDPLARPVEAAGSGGPVQPKLEENCGTDRAINPSSRSAKDLVYDADGTRRKADKADSPDDRARQIAASVEQYRTALSKDPYSADATLGLAIAYDALNRKGCAMRMLTRINALAKYEPYRTAAESAADEVKANMRLFQWYRTEAERAVGR